MKKSIITLILAFASVFSASAAGYRGIAEVDFGYLVSNNFNRSGYTMYKPRTSFGATITNGAQFNKLYLGIGTGCYLSSDEGFLGEITSIRVPAFAMIRVDLFSTSFANFWASMQLGYSFDIPTNLREYFESEDHPYSTDIWRANKTNYFLWQPSIGVRFRCGQRFGINLGLTYYPRSEKYYVGENRYEYDYETDEGRDVSRIDDSFKVKFGYVALRVGFDF